MTELDSGLTHSVEWDGSLTPAYIAHAYYVAPSPTPGYEARAITLKDHPMTAPHYVAHAYYGDGSGTPALLITRNPDDVIEFMDRHASENVLVYKITPTAYELIAGIPLPEETS